MNDSSKYGGFSPNTESHAPRVSVPLHELGSAPQGRLQIQKTLCKSWGYASWVGVSFCCRSHPRKCGPASPLCDTLPYWWIMDLSISQSIHSFNHSVTQSSIHWLIQLLNHPSIPCISPSNKLSNHPSIHPSSQSICQSINPSIKFPPTHSSIHSMDILKQSINS